MMQRRRAEAHLIHGEYREIQLIEAAAEVVLLVREMRHGRCAPHAEKNVEVVENVVLAQDMRAEGQAFCALANGHFKSDFSPHI